MTEEGGGDDSLKARNIYHRFITVFLTQWNTIGATCATRCDSRFCADHFYRLPKINRMELLITKVRIGFFSLIKGKKATNIWRLLNPESSLVESMGPKNVASHFARIRALCAKHDIIDPLRIVNICE